LRLVLAQVMQKSARIFPEFGVCFNHHSKIEV